MIDFMFEALSFLVTPAGVTFACMLGFLFGVKYRNDIWTEAYPDLPNPEEKKIIEKFKGVKKP